MDFKNIPVSAQPAYTWLWNSTITKEGIKQQIDEMYECGIRAFYALGEPEYFRPHSRRTYLSPEYLSDEYIELVHYAYSYAKEKGMYTWLYNEGGFPSGMVCGKIRREHPELAQKIIRRVSVLVKAGEEYQPSKTCLSAFIDATRVQPGAKFDVDTTLTEYIYEDNRGSKNQSDNASLRNTELFLEMTHEKLKERFGEAMGTDVTLMFDDEAYMGDWTDGLDKMFFEKYGYDMNDYLPYIKNAIKPTTPEQYRASSDYFMLCGDLVRNNYFIPMRQWLRANNMYSTGHLDRDHRSDNCRSNRYGNGLATLRAFDVPGIDVIWSQIHYCKKGKCTDEGMQFFPRMASSAARQLGHSTCMSESFAVYGAHVTPEMMRFCVNYQAVRGISLYNFMVISYDRKTAMPLQYRPNFIMDNPSMDRLAGINDYTARLSYILQQSKADIDTALYYPARTICAGGELGRRAMAAFDKMGKMLEEKGVSFDIIDEELVARASLVDGVLVDENVAYKDVFLPVCDLEPTEVMEKMSSMSSEIRPVLGRKNKGIMARKVVFANGDEGYFICNCGENTVSDDIRIASKKNVYSVDLYTGKVYTIPYTKRCGVVKLPLTLLRSEGVFILLTDEKIEAEAPKKTEAVSTLDGFSSYVSRVYTIEKTSGMNNVYYQSGQTREGLYEWDKAFSGEVMYSCALPSLENGEYVLDLGEVRYTAVAYIDGEKIGEITMPPYRIPFKYNGGKTLSISVANMAANACAHTEYFDGLDIRDIGPYHSESMNEKELQEPGGGLFGPVVIEKVCE